MISERFVELLTKKLSGELSTEEAVEFDNFLADSQENRQHYQCLEDYWMQDREEYSNSDLMFQKIVGKLQVPETATQPVPAVRNTRSYLWRSLAAAIVLLICASAAYWLYTHTDANTADLQLTRVPNRTKTKIVLSDGTKVTLNSATDFKYPPAFTGNTREVYLNGEAFFEVTKDRKHPFIVHTGKMNVKVLGTEFNVKSYANDATTETTLIRGSVEITLADRPSDRIILKPHDKLILNNNYDKKSRLHNRLANMIQPRRHINYTLTDFTYFRANDSTVVETSWLDNKLTFKNESFAGLANQLERWYGVKIKFKNDVLKDYHFSGEFHNENIREALAALQVAEPFKYKLKELNVYIY